MSLSPAATESSGTRRLLRARLQEKREVAPRHFAFSLHCPHIAETARAGQFVHVLPHSRPEATDDTFSFDPFLRRAFSIMDARDDHFEILFRIEGRGTANLARAEIGEWLDLVGPLGNGFSLDKAKEQALLVGGGVGVPPMVLTGRSLKQRGVATQMLLGARTVQDILCETQFETMNIPLFVATDDGSRGHHGRVGDLLERELKHESPDAVFACGPLPMLRAVALLCEKYNVECEVSLEENMPCGIGVCNGCVVPMRQTENVLEGDDYGRYQRICVHGPACDARTIDWK